MSDLPEAKPQSHSYRELPGEPPGPAWDQAFHALLDEMATIQRGGGATYFRVTLVSPDYPNPPYSDGVYLEGWDLDPARMDPPHKPARFAPPVTAVVNSP